MDEVKLKSEELKEIFERNSVVLAYVFGSRARKTTGLLSDYDFAVLFSSNIEREEYFDRELKILKDLKAFLKTDRVDLVNLNKSKDPLLRYNATLLGKPVFAEDRKIKFQMENSIMKEYEDTKYLRKIQHYFLTKHLEKGTFGKGELLAKSKYMEKYVAHKQRSN
jgi:uncharacterized protein